MSKKRRQYAKSRDAPAKQSYSTSWLCSPDAWNVLIGGGYRRLSQCPEVRMCVHKYADLISSMTLYLMRNTKKGDVRIKNGLSQKMDLEPNTLMTRKQFVYNIVWSLMLDGNGNQVTYPRYTADGHLENLEPLPPSRVSFIPNEADRSYRIRYGDTVFAPDEVLHFVINPDPDTPWMGTGYQIALGEIVKGLRQAMATKQALMQSPTPSIIVKVDGLTEEFNSADGRRKLRAQYLDSSEHGEPWFIPAEAFSVEQVKPLTLNDLAIKSNMELDKRAVASIFGVPPFLVGVGEHRKDEYNNFITSCVMPMAKNIEQELTRKLLYSPDMYIKFNIRSLYAYDVAEIINAGSQMVDRMAMTRNELRDWLGMGPHDEMDELVALENYIPANMLGQQSKLKEGGGANG